MKDLQQTSGTVPGKEECLKGSNRVLPREYQQGDKDPRPMWKLSLIHI